MRGRSGLRFLVILLAVIAVTLLSACRSLGPSNLGRDQLDYGASIGNNWKNQMLANIVKLRFVDMPVFVDVGSIVSGHTLETIVQGRVGFSDSFTGSNSQGLNAGGRYTDRPTITYMPKTGDDYLRSLLAPVEPKNLLALVQAGYNAELLFTWAVEAINGVHNYSGMAANMQADRQFYEFTQLLRELQLMGAVAWEFETDPETGHDILLVLRRDHPSDEVMAKARRIREIIGLDDGLDRFQVVYAPFMESNDVLALQTRSVLQTLSAMSGFVDVPDDLSEQAMPGFLVRDGLKRPFHVRSGTDRPEQSYAEFKYQDYWFWIEPTDMDSKRVFTLMLFLTTLTNNAGEGAGPVLTIPTG
jgi:hypothetical protein